ncbi:MAG: hypothetical protein KDA60_11020, partial [Planctomycetales bacterium]|nr:hypothetical protein [Planctomycetales bacterium]
MSNPLSSSSSLVAGHLVSWNRRRQYLLPCTLLLIVATTGVCQGTRSHGGELQSGESLFSTSSHPEPRVESPESPLRLRRVYVPQSAIPQLGQGKRLVLKQTLERQLAEISDAMSPLPRHSARLIKADYRARWQELAWRGSANLEIELRGDTPHVFQFPPLGMYLHALRWADDTTRDVQYGTTDTGQFIVVVPRSGVLQFDWSQTATAEPFGVHHTSFALPSSPISQLELTVPSGHLVSATAGIVTELPAANSPPTPAASVRPASGVANLAGASGSSRWLVELGGHSHFDLSLSPRTNERRYLAEYSGNVTYDISPLGLDFVARFLLRPRHREWDRMLIDLDDDVEVVMATVGGLPAEWSLITSGTGPRQLLVQLPASLLTGEPVVQISGKTVLRPQEPWHLPTLIPRDMFWQESTAVIRIFEPLSLDEIDLPEGQVISKRRLSDLRAGISLRARLGGERERIQVQVSDKPPSFRVSQGITVEMQGDITTATSKADIYLSSECPFELPVTLPANWIIENVNCNIGGFVRRWERLASTADTSSWKLHLQPPDKTAINQFQLTFQLASESNLLPTEINANAGEFSHAQLALLDFPTAQQVDRVISLNASGDLRLRHISGAGVTWISPAQLDDATRSRLTEFGQIIYRPLSPRPTVRFRAQPGMVDFSADIDIDTTWTPYAVREDLQIACHSVSKLPSRVYVRFTAKSDAHVKWTLAEPSTAELTARRLGPDEAESWGQDTAGEIWELTLNDYVGTSVVITASCQRESTHHSPESNPLPTNLHIADAGSRMAPRLVHLLQANSQTGHVIFRVEQTRLLILDTNDGLQPSTISRNETERDNRIAAFRYDPQRLTSEGQTPQIEVAAPEESLPAAWIWSNKTQSRYTKTGSTIYHTHCLIENHGEDSAILRIPRPLILRRLVLNGEHLDVTRSLANQRSVSLPPGARFVSLFMECTASQKPWGNWTSIRVPPLGVFLPTFETQHVLWAPDGYSLSSPLIMDNAREGWPAKFFGRFGQIRTAGKPSEPNLPVATTVPPPGLLRADSESASQSSATPPADWGVSSGQAVVIVKRVDDEGQVLRFYYRPIFIVIGWATFLATASALTVTPRGNRRTLVALGIVSAGLSLFMEGPATPIILGVFWGLVVAVLWRSYRLTLINEIVRVDTPPVLRDSNEPAAATTWLIAVLLCLNSTAIHAQTIGSPGSRSGNATRDDTTASSENTARMIGTRIHEILIPVDADGHASSEHVVISEELYEIVRERTDSASPIPADGWIESVIYRGQLQRSPLNGSLSMGNLTATYRVRVTTPSLLVSLPYDAPEGAANALVDGQALTAPIEKQHVLVILEEIGVHEVVLPLSNVLRENQVESGLDIGIAPVPNARVELVVPGGVDVTLPSVRGRVLTDPTTGRLIAELGPAEQLSIRWQETPDVLQSGGPIARIQQLSRLAVASNSVRLFVRIKLSLGTGEIERLKLAVDENLNLVEPNNVPWQSTQERGSDGSQEITLTKTTPWTGNETVALEFTVGGVSSLRNLVLPQVQVMSPIRATHWAGIAVTDDIELSIAPPNPYPIVPRLEFLDAWDVIEPIDSAFDITNRVTPLELQFRPRSPAFNAKQHLELTFFRNDCLAVLTADVEPVRGSTFQYRLRVPPGFRYQKGTVASAGTELPSRWTTVDDRSLNVHLLRTTTSPLHFELHGEIPTVQTHPT